MSLSVSLASDVLSSPHLGYIGRAYRTVLSGTAVLRKTPPSRQAWLLSYADNVGFILEQSQFILILKRDTLTVCDVFSDHH